MDSLAADWVDEFERVRRGRLVRACSLAALAAALTVVRVSSGLAKLTLMLVAIGLGLAGGVVSSLVRHARARERSSALPAPGFLVAHLDDVSGPRYAVAMADRSQLYLMALGENGAPYAERTLVRSRLQTAKRGWNRYYVRILGDATEAPMTLRVPRGMIRALATSQAVAS